MIYTHVIVFQSFSIILNKFLIFNKLFVKVNVIVSIKILYYKNRYEKWYKYILFPIFLFLHKSGIG